MRRIAIFGCIIASFLLFITPNLSAINYDTVQSNVENKVETTSVSMQVHGGLGISIDLVGVTDNTVISTLVTGLLFTDTNAGSIKFNKQRIHIATFSLFPNDFQLYVNVNGQPFSYEGLAFFLFIGSIKPIDS